MSYQKCPCCDGWGEREKPNPHQGQTANAFPEKIQCKACHGRGLVGMPPVDFTPRSGRPFWPNPMASVEYYAGDPNPLQGGTVTNIVPSALEVSQ